MTASDAGPVGDGGGGNDDRPDERAARAAARLRQAVQADATGRVRREDLQAAAHELVRALRGAHRPPEQVLVQIKRILADAGLQPAFSGDDAAAGDETSHGALLYRDIIAWCIRYYYDDLAG